MDLDLEQWGPWIRNVGALVMALAWTIRFIAQQWAKSRAKRDRADVIRARAEQIEARATSRSFETLEGRLTRVEKERDAIRERFEETRTRAHQAENDRNEATLRAEQWMFLHMNLVEKIRAADVVIPGLDLDEPVTPPPGYPPGKTIPEFPAARGFATDPSPPNNDPPENEGEEEDP